ncbi:MAG: SpaA isopeptide-forming pilin-related protein [Brooklawnia sp.]
MATAESTPAEEPADEPVADEGAQTDAPAAETDTAATEAPAEQPADQSPAAEQDAVASPSAEAQDEGADEVATFSSSGVCKPTDLYYSLDYSGYSEVWKYDSLAETRTYILTHSGNLGGMAAHGGYLYGFEAFQSTTLLRYDLSTGETVRITGLPTADTSYDIVGAAVNPVTGILYYLAYEGVVYAFDTATNKAIGFVGNIAGFSSNGDLAFDPDGNMYAYGSRLKISKINAADVPTTAQASGTVLPDTRVVSAAQVNPHGLAWMSESDTPLWSTYWDERPVYGWAEGNNTVRPILNLASDVVIDDMASCPVPATHLTVSKDLVGRYDNGDQFKLDIAQGGNVVATATTTGTSNGVQAASASLGMPVAGATYTVRETAASGDLANYSSELVCTNTDTGQAIATSKTSDTEYSFTYPGAANQSVACEFTNTPKSTLALSKTLSGGRVAASDQFTIQVRQGGSDGSVVAQSTTAGQGTTVSSGTGVIARMDVESNQQYTITEAAGPGVDASKYTPRLTCTDANGQTSNLPNAQALDPTAGISLNLKPGSKVSCSLDNYGEGASIGLGEGLTCKTGEIYGIASQYPGTVQNSYSQVFKINTATGAVTAVPVSDVYLKQGSGYQQFNGNLNSLAISQGGLHSYYSAQSLYTIDYWGYLYGVYGQSPGLPVFKQYNEADGAFAAGDSELLAVLNIPGDVDYGYAAIVRGGINPTDGVYWLSSSQVVNNTTRHHFWAYNTLTDQAYGYVGYITGPVGTNGDLVFDQDGNMLFVSSSTTKGELWRLQSSVLNGVLDAAPRSVATAISTSSSTLVKITDLSLSARFNGVTFDNDGYLWVSSGSTGVESYIYKLDPNTGQTIGSRVSIRFGNFRAITDLADCNDPGGIRLQKDYPDGRVSADDQVTLKITRDGLAADIPGGTVTTTGNNAGLQSESASVVIGVPKNTYTLTETRASGAPLSDYTTSDLVCVDKTHGDTPVNPENLTKINDHQWKLNFEAVSSSDGQLLSNVVCTFINRPNGTLQLAKQLVGDRADDADQFQVQITTGGSVVADAVTAGSGSTVEGGVTDVVRAQAGKEYSFDELGVRAGATSEDVLGGYLQPRLTCTDPTGRQPVEDLPSNVRLDESGSIKPVPGAQISCVISNQAMPVYAPGFEMTKTANPESGTEVKAGDTITYTVTGVNTGDTTLDPVEIVDDLGDVLDNATLDVDSLAASIGEAPVFDEDAKTLTWTGSLLPSATVTLVYTVTVNDGQGGELVKNVASSSATPIIPDPDDPRGPGTPGEPITPPEVSTEHPIPLDRGITVEKFGANCDTDQELCALPGAEFALYDTDPALADSRPIEDGLSVNDEGSVFVSVPLASPGTYWLVETKAPSGFNLLATPVQFNLTESGVELVGEPGQGVSLKDGSAFTIQVVDTTPAPLPHSGGTGPVPHMVAAVLLFGAALTYQVKTSGRLRRQVGA